MLLPFTATLVYTIPLYISVYKMMKNLPHSGGKAVISFRDSLIKALDEERFDDLLLLLSNRLRLRQQTVSPLARKAIPIDATKASPLRNTKLTSDEINTFDIRDRGWHLIALKDHAIIGAERFPVRHDDPRFRKSLLEYVETIVSYYGKDALVVAAYHKDGMLIEWQFLNDFTAEPVR